MKPLFENGTAGKDEEVKLFLLLIEDRHIDTYVGVFSSLDLANKAVEHCKKGYRKAYEHTDFKIRWKKKPLYGYESHWVCHDDGPTISVRKTTLDPKDES